MYKTAHAMGECKANQTQILPPEMNSMKRYMKWVLLDSPYLILQLTLGLMLLDESKCQKNS